MAKKEQNDLVITREHVCMTADDMIKSICLAVADTTSYDESLNRLTLSSALPSVR